MSEERKGDILEFECIRCGNCCQWEGAVLLSEEETLSIAVFLGLDVFEFTDAYTHLTPDRCHLSLIERVDGVCIFYDDAGKKCEIYQVRPQQCRTFPHHWRFPGWEGLCNGRYATHGI